MLCATCGKPIERVKTCPECKGVAELRGEYVLLSVLGRGANGVTYEAERLSDGRRVAVKEMPIGTMDSVKALELFEREASVLRQISHRAIPAYVADFTFGIGKATALYLVQELVSGVTLAEEAKARRYTNAEVWVIVGEIAGVLAFLHRLAPPVIHRDIKPANVMRRDDGALCLIDFGSVREAMKASGGSTVAGTFGYMAPEQLAGRASPASDLYALGALAVALLSRKEPDTLLDDDHTVAFDDHVDVTRAERAFLAALLARAPEERPASANDVRARAIALSKPSAPRSEPAPEPERERAAPTAPRGGADAQVPWDTKGRRNKGHRGPRGEPAAPPAAPKEPGLDPARRRLVLGAVAASLVSLSGIVSFLLLRGPTSTTPVNVASAAPPEIYARPLVVDTNGDGVEDVIQVVGVEQGPQTSGEDGEDTYAKTDGRFLPHVQAIDGATGKPLYTLAGLGASFASNPSLEGKMPRTVLAALSKRLLVVHVNPNDTVVDAVDLGTGKRVQSATFEPVSGLACMRDGKLVLARRGITGGVVVDVATLARRTEAPSEPCPPGSASPLVADAPDPKASSQSPLEARFSVPARVTSGPDVGAAAVRSGGRLAYVRVPAQAKGPPTSLPRISFSEAGGQAGGKDNTEIRVVIADATTGSEIAAPSLADLGLPTETVAHLVFVGADVLAVLEGESGLVRMSADGKARWRRQLPKGTRVLSYTLTAERAYLHTVETETTIYGFLSKKVRSRTLVLDLVKGTWIRSIPEGPLEPRPAPPKYEPKLEAVTGCVCPRTPSQPETALLLGTSSTLQTGGKTYYGAHFAFDVGGARRILVPYTQKRERIVPPRTLEGMVPLAMACGEGRAVFAHDALATAWDLATGKELWTVDLPRSRGARPTSLGGAATVVCAVGVVEKGRATLPMLEGAPLVLDLADGAAAKGSLAVQPDGGKR